MPQYGRAMAQRRSNCPVCHDCRHHPGRDCWPAATATAQEFAGRDKLRAHSAEFRQEVIKVTEGVHVAVGFDVCNAILLEGPDGAIIVDTLMSVASARQVRAAFEKISRKPIRAIIYTHFHPDHVGGAAAFAEGHTPDVYAHVALLEENRPANVDRGGRDGGNQFSTPLPESLRINDGVGSRVLCPARRDTSARREPLLVNAPLSRLPA